MAMTTQLGAHCPEFGLEISCMSILDLWQVLAKVLLQIFTKLLYLTHNPLAGHGFDSICTAKGVLRFSRAS